MGQRSHRRRDARAGLRICRADARRELSRLARQPGQLSGQHPSDHAARAARGKRGRDCARLRENHRQTAGRRTAQQRGAPARVDGDLQCVVRAGADADLRRQRPDGCRGAPSVDRLGAYLHRPGGARAPLHQVGQPAGVAGRNRGSDAARFDDRANNAVRADLCDLRFHVAGGKARQAVAHSGCRTLQSAVACLSRSRPGTRSGHSAHASEAAFAARRTRQPVARSVEQSHRAGRSARCARVDEPEDVRRISIGPSVARRHADQIRQRFRDR